jgi:hypothetical protein
MSASSPESTSHYLNARIASYAASPRPVTPIDMDTEEYKEEVEVDDDVEVDADADADASMEEEHADVEAGGGEEGKVDGDSSAAAPRTLKRPMTAYFLFMAAIRPTVMAELDAAAAAESAESGAEVKTKSRTLAVVGKIVGDRWKAMTDEEKEVGDECIRAIYNTTDTARE